MREAQPAVELVLEGGAVDGLAAGARAGRVACLRHELMDHAVDDDTVVVALHAELHEVAAGERRLLGPELDATLVCSTTLPLVVGWLA